MCKFFNSCEESLHVDVCKLAKYVRNCVVFWKNLHSWQKFYTTADHRGRGKFQVWDQPITFDLTSSASSSLSNAHWKKHHHPQSIDLVRIIMLCQLELFPSHLPSNFDIVVWAVWSTTNRVKKKESLEPRTKNQDQVYCVWLMKWVIKREIFQLAQLCPTRWSIISDTSWY